MLIFAIYLIVRNETRITTKVIRKFQELPVSTEREGDQSSRPINFLK